MAIDTPVIWEKVIKIHAQIRPRSEQSYVPTELMRTETVREQKPVRGVEGRTAILRKEWMKNYETVREWRKGKGSKA